MVRIVRKSQGDGLEELARRIESLKGLQTKVGWNETAKYKDGTPVAYVAAIQEFGHGPIPPRSFMRTTVAEQSGNWSKLVEGGAKAVLKGAATIRDVMDGLGQQAAGDIRKKISQITSPPLKEATIQARLRGYKDQSGPVGNLTKPLVHTGHMLATCTYTVEEK